MRGLSESTEHAAGGSGAAKRDAMLPRLVKMHILLGPVLPDLLKAETLPDLFETTAGECPEATALSSDGRTWSYAELDRVADTVAHWLIADDWGGAGRIIALWLPRGADALVAQLGISKSGAAWLPCDADTPPERVAQCARDAQVSALITTRDLASRLPPLHGIPILEMGELLALLFGLCLVYGEGWLGLYCTCCGC